MMLNENAKSYLDHKKLDEYSSLVYLYLASTDSIEVINSRMIARALKRLYLKSISTTDVEKSLEYLSKNNIAILTKRRYMFNREISDADYYDLNESQKVHVTSYFQPTEYLYEIRKNANISSKL